MFVKLRFYYRARDSAQNGGQVEKVTTILRPVRSNASLKPRQILYQKCVYLRVKKESGNQRESIHTNLVAIFEDNHSTGPKEQ